MYITIQPTLSVVIKGLLSLPLRYDLLHNKKVSLLPFIAELDFLKVWEMVCHNSLLLSKTS